MALLSSLTNRIFLASALLTVLTTVIASYLVNVRVTGAVEDDLQRGLMRAGALVDHQHTARVEELKLQARLVADLPKLIAAVDTADPTTVEPFARAYWALVKSDVLVVTDRAGTRLASIGTATGASEREPAAAVGEALARREVAMFWPHPAGILQVVTVPVAAGPAPSDLVGTLSIGALFDDRLANEFKGVTESDIAFAADGRIKAATLPRAQWGALAAALEKPGISRIWVGNDEYTALVRPLVLPVPEAANGAAPEAVSSPDTSDRRGPFAIILRSRTERLHLLRAVHAALGIMGLAAVLLATVLSYAVARTVTRPLGAITTGMRDVAATGDLTRKISLPAGRWVDEDARLLATTFNALTDSVARFQREAAKRDRLLALGRLSTVIAHEIRNPLMIIKAALRPLRDEGTAPDQVREAAADVEEEVARLNRIVNDVLDFARPTRFDLAEADINRIAADAAAAAGAGDGAGSITLALDPALRPLVTDAERVRGVLVNLLANARQAVRARLEAEHASARPDHASGTPGQGDVVVTTSRAGSARVAITVRDRGEGIGPEDLTHVFDPFFTTRRGGTGLGLPIARNIIEGLGGTMTIRSQRGDGTEVRVELPTSLQADPK